MEEEEKKQEEEEKKEERSILLLLLLAEHVRNTNARRLSTLIRILLFFPHFAMPWVRITSVVVQNLIFSKTLKFST